MLCRNDFAASWFLCGMDVLMMAYIEDPNFADALAKMVSDYCCELFGLCVAAGVDVIYLTDDMAYKTGTLFSRDHLTGERSRGGGHVLSSGNTITVAVKPENFRAMVEAGKAASMV